MSAEITYAIPVCLICDAPIFTTPPTAQTADEDGNATFTVVVTGDATIALQWQVSTDLGTTWTDVADNAIYGGSRSETLTLNAAPYSYNDYRYRCVAVNGCGTTYSTAAMLTDALTGHTYSGNFIWYGTPPLDGSPGPGLNPDPLGSGGAGPNRVPDYYLRRTVTGFATMIQAPYGPDGSTGGGPHGTCGSITLLNLGGSIVTDAITGAVSGNFAGQWLLSGNFCSGSSWRGSYGGYTGDITLNVSGTALEPLLPFFSYDIIGPLGRTCGTDDYPSPGYLETYCGNGMWGNPGDFAFEVLSQQDSPNQASTAGGGAEIAFNGQSEVDSYNPATGAMVGLSSEVNVQRSRLSTTGSFLVTYNYSCVPVGGGAIQTFSETDSVAVGVGNPLSTIKQVPMIVGYKVSIASIAVGDLMESSDDFATYPDGWTRTLGNGANWAAAGTFGMSQPGESADSFDSLTNGVYTVIASGDNWAGQGTFGMSETTEAWDDFGAYASGTINLVIAGFGWTNPGTFGWNDYPQSWDDFSGFTNGGYDTLVNTDIIWISSGTFGLNDYLVASDDFGGYANDSYLTLSGGLNWAAAGTFG